MIDKFYGPVAALCVGALGALFAYCALTRGWAPAALGCGLLALVGWLLGEVGASLALWRRVRLAGFLVEFWVLTPLAAAAALTALLILAKAWSTAQHVPGVAEADSKEIIDALSTTLVAFVGAIILKAADDADEEWTAPRFSRLLEDHFKQGVGANAGSVYHYDPAARPELESALVADVFPGGAGWSFSARRKRIDIIANNAT
jgi:hypothetical protein